MRSDTDRPGSQGDTECVTSGYRKAGSNVARHAKSGYGKAGSDGERQVTSGYVKEGIDGDRYVGSEYLEQVATEKGMSDQKTI